MKSPNWGKIICLFADEVEYVFGHSNLYFCEAFVRASWIFLYGDNGLFTTWFFKFFIYPGYKNSVIIISEIFSSALRLSFLLSAYLLINRSMNIFLWWFVLFCPFDEIFPYPPEMKIFSYLSSRSFSAFPFTFGFRI